MWWHAVHSSGCCEQKNESSYIVGDAEFVVPLIWKTQTPGVGHVFARDGYGKWRAQALPY